MSVSWETDVRVGEAEATEICKIKYGEQETMLRKSPRKRPLNLLLYIKLCHTYSETSPGWSKNNYKVAIKLSSGQRGASRAFSSDSRKAAS